MAIGCPDCGSIEYAETVGTLEVVSKNSNGAETKRRVLGVFGEPCDSCFAELVKRLQEHCRLCLGDSN